MSPLKTERATGWLKGELQPPKQRQLLNNQCTVRPRGCAVHRVSRGSLFPDERMDGHFWPGAGQLKSELRRK
jgi:hypothetical protein